jgi:hypothetical protein
MLSFLIIDHKGIPMLTIKTISESARAATIALGQENFTKSLNEILKSMTDLTKKVLVNQVEDSLKFVATQAKLTDLGEFNLRMNAKKFISSTYLDEKQQALEKLIADYLNKFAEQKFRDITLTYDDALLNFDVILSELEIQVASVRRGKFDIVTAPMCSNELTADSADENNSAVVLDKNRIAKNIERCDAEISLCFNKLTRIIKDQNNNTSPVDHIKDKLIAIEQRFEQRKKHVQSAILAAGELTNKPLAISYVEKVLEINNIIQTQKDFIEGFDVKNFFAKQSEYINRDYLTFASEKKRLLAEVFADNVQLTKAVPVSRAPSPVPAVVELPFEICQKSILTTGKNINHTRTTSVGSMGFYRVHSASKLHRSQSGSNSPVEICSPPSISGAKSPPLHGRVNTFGNR